MKRCVALLFTLLFAWSCAAQSDGSNARIRAHVMDWENSGDYLPTNPPDVVPFPWKGAAGSANAELLHDYRSADGWLLVYNTFGPGASPYFPTMPPGGLFFALYNRYRGLLRFYLYVPPGWTSPSSYVQHGLQTVTSGGHATSLLNFDTAAFINIDIPQTAISKTNNQPLQALGGWVIAQYELAYDPHIGATDRGYPGLALRWWAKTYNITELRISGALTGALTGTLSQPGSEWRLGDLFSKQIPNAFYSVFGAKDLGEFLVKAAEPPLKAETYQANARKAYSQLLSSNINGFFSALMGRSNDGSKTYVDLKLQCDLEMTGNLTSSTGITQLLMPFPGQYNAQTNPDQWIPFNEAMGVFNLTARPRIRYQLLSVRNSSCNICTPPKEIISERYTIDPQSYQIVYNDKVLEKANIANVRTQIVAIKHDSGPLGSMGGNGSFGTLEQVGLQNVYAGASPVVTGEYTRGYGNNTPGGWADWGIRIAIDVIPHDGAPVSTIVKTFAATVN